MLKIKTKIALICVLALPAVSGKGASPESVDFQRDIAPIFADACYECHGAHEPQGQIRLDSKDSVFAGGFSGPGIVPNNPDESLIYQRLTATDVDLRMPHQAEPLPAEKIALIRRWIEQGAVWPESAAGVSGIQTHWAYVKPVRPELPTVQDSAWVRNAIDAFVLTRLEQEGIRPSSEATKEKLLRRVSLDLIGLPPTPAEVDAFLADTSPEAYERVVDRLLESPHYGERWAQPWLDAARYADSNGFTNDRQRSIWPYRDWVIQAYNDDLPFDQFTIQQIAGDLLPNATVSQQVATGFHRNTMYNDEQGVDQGEARWNAMVDRVGTTATVWLGTTLACAQCHNHKYDPFSQSDFYGLLAFFENTDFAWEGVTYNRRYVEPVLDLAPSEAQQRRKSLEKAIDKLQKQIYKSANSAASEAESASRESWQRELAERKIELEALAKQYPQTMVLRERPAEGPLTTHLRIKGGYLAPGEIVSAAVPRVLPTLPPDATGNRLTLARWLVAPENPLTARVIVNRYWSQFFGRGIVETEEDFGTRGAQPSHPELLDWLATEFVRLGWSTKQLHKLIATSSTYRQSSQFTRESLERDPLNRLLARGPKFRLSAEYVRDVTLSISGLLSQKMGGPGVFPPQPNLSSLQDHGDFAWIESQGEDRYRRGIYTFWRRTALYPALMNFDAPSREACTVRRPRSSTPLQALTLLNDRTAADAAVALAKRIRTESGSAETSQRAQFAFRLCTSRQPLPAELAAIENAYQQSALLMEQDAPAATRIAANAEESTDPQDFAAWFLVSQALLNLDEVLSKE